MLRFLFLFSFCFLMGCASHSNKPYDVIIIDGTVYRDGDSDPIITDVGIVGEKIQAIKNLDINDGKEIIDAHGKLVVPGFIDTHSHGDDGGPMDQYLVQGVTTIVAGNCGRSLDVTQLEQEYENLEGRMGPNYIGLIGHNSIRRSIDLEEADPSPEQLQLMKDYIRDGMNAGAFGMSTGLIYNPGFNSKTEELIELASIVGEYDGLYTTHMRNEGPEVLQSVVEAIMVGERSNSRVQISHAKCAGPQAWGLSDEFLTLVDDANALGTEVWVDQYPYSASQTTINAVIPDWAENDWENSVSNKRAELEEGIRELIAGRGGAERIYMVRGPYAKQTLGEVVEELNEAPEKIIIDRIGLGGASAIYHMMLEEDVQTFMTHPRVMVGSDGPSSTHPRGHGSFPRVWGHYGRELGLVSHQDCVRKTSTLPAIQFRLLDQQRGKIQEGFFADIAVLDPDEIIDHATFDEPTAYPVGVTDVLVNGAIAISNGEYTKALSGKVLRYQDSKRYRFKT